MSLVSQVQIIIDEPSGPKFWPLAQLYDAINESSVEVLGSAQQEITTATVTASASATYLALPTTIMIPKFLLSTSGREIPMTNYGAMEQDSPNWGTATGTEIIAFMEFDVNNLRLYPIVTTPKVYYVVGVPYPTEVTTGVDDFTTIGSISTTVRFLAGSVLMEATRPDLADTFRVEGMGCLVDAMRLWRNQQGQRVWQLQPAGRINARRSGDLGVIRGYR